MGSDEKKAWEKKLDAAISDLRHAQETMAKTASDEFPDHDDWQACSEQMEHYSGRARRRLRELRPMIRAVQSQEGLA